MKIETHNGVVETFNGQANDAFTLENLVAEHGLERVLTALCKISAENDVPTSDRIFSAVLHLRLRKKLDKKS